MDWLISNFLTGMIGTYEVPILNSLLKFLSNIYMFLQNIYIKENILLNNILYWTAYWFRQHVVLYNIYGLHDTYVQQHKYVYEQNIYVIQFVHDFYIL